MNIYTLYIEGFAKPVQVMADKFETRDDYEVFLDAKENTVFMVFTNKLVAIDLSLVPKKNA